MLRRLPSWGCWGRLNLLGGRRAIQSVVYAQGDRCRAAGLVNRRNRGGSHRASATRRECSCYLALGLPLMQATFTPDVPGQIRPVNQHATREDISVRQELQVRAIPHRAHLQILAAVAEREAELAVNDEVLSLRNVSANKVNDLAPVIRRDRLIPGLSPSPPHLGEPVDIDATRTNVFGEPQHLVDVGQRRVHHGAVDIKWLALLLKLLDGQIDVPEGSVPAEGIENSGVQVIPSNPHTTYCLCRRVISDRLAEPAATVCNDPDPQPRLADQGNDFREIRMQRGFSAEQCDLFDEASDCPPDDFLNCADLHMLATCEEGIA